MRIRKHGLAFALRGLPLKSLLGGLVALSVTGLATIAPSGADSTTTTTETGTATTIETETTTFSGRLTNGQREARLDVLVGTGALSAKVVLDTPTQMDLSVIDDAGTTLATTGSTVSPLAVSVDVAAGQHGVVIRAGKIKGNLSYTITVVHAKVAVAEEPVAEEPVAKEPLITEPLTTAYVVPSTIDATCSTDVTEQLNSWLASVPDGTSSLPTVIDLAGGCYLSNGTILLKSRQHLVIDGAGATIMANADIAVYTNRAQLAITLGRGFIVRNLTLKGTNPGTQYKADREWDHNLRLWGAQDVLVENVAFRTAWGDAVSLHGGGSWDAQGVGAVLANNVTVQNSTVDGTGRHAFTCTGCVNFLVQDNSITNVGYHVADVEVEAETWTGDITMLRNRFSNVHLSFLAATTGAGVDLGPFIVRDNVQETHPKTCQPPVHIGGHGYPVGKVEITGNSMLSYSDGLMVQGSTGLVIADNTVKVGGGGCGLVGGDSLDGKRGLELTNVTRASVTGNTFPNASDLALVVTSTEVAMCGNRLSTTDTFSLPTPC